MYKVRIKLNIYYKIIYHMKYKFNINPFINIFDPNICYYLGFLWSDGSIRKYESTIEIVKEDYLSISHIFNVIGNKYEIDFVTKYRERVNRKPQAYIRITKKKFSDFLIKNNYNNKSSYPIILDKIPDKLKLYFFRGIIDGDGCFYKKNNTVQFYITSRQDQDWSYIENMFIENKINYKISRISKKLHSYSYIRVTNIGDITKLYNYLYSSNDGIFLKRKYDKCKEIVNSNIKSRSIVTDDSKKELMEYYSSGKSLKEYAIINNLPEHSVYGRIRRIRDKNKKNHLL